MDKTFHLHCHPEKLKQFETWTPKMNPNWKCLALISFALPHIVRMWVRSCNIISTQILSHAPNLGVSPKLGSQHFTQSQFTKLSNSSCIYLFCTHIIITKFLKMYGNYFELQWKMFYKIQSIRISTKFARINCFLCLQWLFCAIQF